MEQFETRTRARVTQYTTACFVALASFLFFDYVSFVPDAPFLPIVLGVALAAISFKSRGAAISCLYLLVFLAILWQMVGFGFFQLLRAGVGVAVLVDMALPLFFFYSRRVELTSMSLAVLCVSLLFTPAYFVSIPLIAAAATVTGFASLGALSLSFILLSFPLILLDNALYFITVPGATTPIAFSQLAYLSHYMRPSLPGLNLFLTPIPPSFVSPLAPEVSSFLAQNWPVLLVPLSLVALVVVVASLAGGVARRYLGRLATARESSLLERVGTPLAVSLVVPAAFIIVIVPLAFTGAGGFQTSLSNEPIDVPLTLAASAALGLAFVGKEFLIMRLEVSEVTRDKVLGYLRESRTAVEADKLEISRIKLAVPSLNTAGEEHSVTEASSYLDDVERRVETAGPTTLIDWASYFEKTLLPSLREAKDRLTIGVVNELATLRGVVAAVNGHLAEASAPARYTPIPDVEVDASLGQIIDLHSRAVKGIERETKTLFGAYVRASDAMNQLLGLKGVTIPVSPDPILESHEYVTAMRLVAEEYWLGFHLRYAEELKDKEDQLAEVLKRLEEFLDLEERPRVKGIEAVVGSAPPAASEPLLSNVEELMALLGSLFSRLADYPEVVKKTIEGVNPAALKFLTLQSSQRRDELIALKGDLASSGPVLDALSKFIGGALPLVSGQSSAVRGDGESLAVLAHYPEARRGIRRMLASTKGAKAEQLPYDRRASALFLRLFAAETKGFRFEEERGALVRG